MAVCRLNGLLVVGIWGALLAGSGGAALSQGSPPKLLATTPIEGKEESRTIQLPGTISDVACGGNGRFLLLYFRDLKKIGVFDISLSKIVGYLPAADDDTLLAAGATRALVFNVSQGVMSRFRLDTLEREASAPIPFGNDSIQQVALGAGSEGPAILRTSRSKGALDQAGFQFLDLNTLKPIEVTWPNGRLPHMSYRDRNLIYPSTNGAVFSVTGFGAIRLSGADVQFVSPGVRGGVVDSVAGGYPSADGSYYLAQGKLLNSEQRPTGEQAAQSGFGVGIPAVTGRYYLTFNAFANIGKGKHQVKLFMFGDNRPLATIQDLPVDLSRNEGQTMYGMNWEKRIFFVPDAHVIVTIPSANDRLELRRLSVEEALEASGIDYLVVESAPLTTALLGKLYSYDIKVKSKRGSVKLKLDSGPPGMNLPPDDKLTWQVPAEMVEETQKVVVSISDASGQATFHSFTIDLPEIQARLALEKQQEEERKKLAQEAAQKKLQEERQAQQAAAIQRVADLKMQRALANQALREWADNTGEFKLSARFVELAEKKTVVLLLENGETRKIPLTRLSDADIYEAVKCDLQQRQGLKPPGAGSPFSKD